MTIKINKAQKGREVFEILKRKKLKISRSKVAKLAGFSKSLLSPDPSGNYRTPSFASLAEDIEKFIKNSGQEPATNQLAACRLSRNDFERKFNKQLEQNVELVAFEIKVKNQVAYHRQQYNVISKKNSELLVQLDHYREGYKRLELMQDGTEASNVEALKTEIISPDLEMLRLNNDEYAYRDRMLQRKSHNAAQGNLCLAVNSNVALRLYITIGRPGAGKTRWIEQHQPPYDRVPIYYDATNSDSGDRMDITNIARTATDIKICFVFFDIPIETCVQQNKNRPEKGITDEVIQKFEIEPPIFGKKIDDEDFDELIIIRN